MARYGIMVNNDAVVRTSYYKYFHPKVMVMVIVMVVQLNYHTGHDHVLLIAGVPGAKRSSQPSGKSLFEN